MIKRDCEAWRRGKVRPSSRVSKKEREAEFGYGDRVCAGVLGVLWGGDGGKYGKQ